MKKLFAVLASAMLLVGCAQQANEPAQEEEEATEEVVEEASGTLRVGVGSSTNISASDAGEDDGSVQVNTTMATVVLDENNVIKYLFLDVAQNTGKFDATGAITTEEGTPTPTKRQKGEDYGMRGVSEATGIGKEWFEQIEGMEAWAVGKTVEEVVGMELVPGTEDHMVATDADLLTTTTISLPDFLDAIKAAADNAIEVEGLAEVAFGTSTDMGYTSASADGDGQVQATVTYLVAALDADGKILALQSDVAQNTGKFDATGAITSADPIPTKEQRGADYGMKGVSEAVGVGLEWFEQNEGFENWAAGKTLGDITGMELVPGTEDHMVTTDADLLTTTTISMTGYVEAAEYAAGNVAAVK